MAHVSDLIAVDIDEYLTSHQYKSLLRFITCGSVDDGKSTLIGRLLYDCKMIYEDQLAAIHRDSERAGSAGGSLSCGGEGSHRLPPAASGPAFCEAVTKSLTAFRPSGRGSIEQPKTCFAPGEKVRSTVTRSSSWRAGLPEVVPTATPFSSYFSHIISGSVPARICILCFCSNSS